MLLRHGIRGEMGGRHVRGGRAPELRRVQTRGRDRRTDPARAGDPVRALANHPEEKGREGRMKEKDRSASRPGLQRV